MIGGFPILSVIGFIVMFGGAVFAITGPRVPGEPVSAAGGPRFKRTRGSGSSFTARMEDRFRRRFDE